MAAGRGNHIMFGDISAWFYEALAGINPDPAKPGFKHIIIRPRPVGDLKWVKAWHRSPLRDHPLLVETRCRQV